MTGATSPAGVLRHGSAAALAQALLDSRRDTLSTLRDYEAVLAAAPTPMAIPYATELNPPLWELGHIAWFQRWWLGRNPQRALGSRADPAARRAPARPCGADHLFDSSHVEHRSRWQLPLPDLHQQHVEAAQSLQETLELLAEVGRAVDTAPATTSADVNADDALYFFRLALAHEDMHHEAALYMAQTLGLPVSDPRWIEPALHLERRDLHVAGGPFWIGHKGPGFYFDNEAGAHEVELPRMDIDSRVVTWNEYMPFVAEGGYQNLKLWSDGGQAWLLKTQATQPRYLRRDTRSSSGWQMQRFGRWLPLNLLAPVCHVNAFEAQAWCRWAGRVLPTEAQWERAASQAGPEYVWGQVWEWTSSPFEPYPGFVAHPYRDYSAPWFGTRQVLRGASFATQRRMHNLRYRNYFTPDRNDIFAGFRSCAI